MILILRQIRGTCQYGVRTDDLSAIYHKFDGALFEHLQDIDEEHIELRLRVEFVLSRMHAYAALSVLLVRQRSDTEGRIFLKIPDFLEQSRFLQEVPNLLEIRI